MLAKGSCRHRRETEPFGIAAQEVLATRQRLGDDVIGSAHALKIEALADWGTYSRRGQWRQRASSRDGRLLAVTDLLPPEKTPETLAKIGVDKKTSALAQKLAALSDTERNAVPAWDTNR